MRRHDLDDRLQEFVAFGMAGVDRLIGTSAADGITSIGAYLQSIGRYSDSSPFLYCCYGCGEMAQAYCRMAAVYGGIYVLRRSVASIHTDGAPTVEAEESNATTQTLCESSGVCLQTAPDSSSRKIKGVILTDGQCVEAAHVISSSECWPVSDHTATAVDVGSNSDVNLRAIIICSNPIPLPSDSSANTSDPGAPLLICIPPSSCPSASIITSCVRLLQLGSSCQVCPDGYYVIHAQCSVPAADIEGSRQELLQKLHAFVPWNEWVWSATYITRTQAVNPRDDVIGLHAVTAVSAASMTNQFYVSEAEVIFKNICGQSSDFLASMPSEDEEQAATVASAASAEASAASENDTLSSVV